MQINQKKAGVALSYVSELIKILSHLLYTPIMLRLLGKSEYGLYQLVYSTVAYLGLLSFGFSASYIRFYTRLLHDDSKEDIHSLNGMFLTVFLALSALVTICGIFMIKNIEMVFADGLTYSEYSTARILMGFMVFNLAIAFPDSVFNCILTAHEQFFIQRLLTVLQNLFNPFLTLPLLLAGYGSVGMVIVSTSLTIIRAALDLWITLFRIHERFRFSHFDFGLLKEMWRFTFFIFLNRIIDQINWGVDKFLLGRMIGTGAVAIYGLGSQINSMYVQLSSSISSVFVPQVNRLVINDNNDEELSKLFTRIGRVQLIVLGLPLTGFIFMGYQFMKLWGGPDFGDSYYVTLWLIIPVTIPLIQKMGIEIQRAKNMHQTRSIVYACVSLFNVILSIPLIKLMGPRGAAMGTAVSLFCGNVLFMNWYYQKRIGLSIPLFWKNIVKFVPAFIIPCIAGVILKHHVQVNTYSILLCGIIYASIYMVSMWLLGMNSSEKALVCSLIRRGRKV